MHAYLHRKEGDRDNARYWYGRAARAGDDGSLETEWAELVRALLARRIQEQCRIKSSIAT